jgi:hypothetical protein
MKALVFKPVRAAASLALIGISIAAITNCTPAYDCVTIGCSSGTTIKASFSLPPSTFEGATFTLCLNGVCSSGVLAPIDGGVHVSSALNVVMTGALYDQSVSLSVDGGGTDVEFAFFSSARESDGGYTTFSLQDGDTYEVKIVGVDNSTILDATQSVTYAMPGGQCGPNCQNADIKVTP